MTFRKSAHWNWNWLILVDSSWFHFMHLSISCWNNFILLHKVDSYFVSWTPGAESPTTDRKPVSPKLSSRCYVQRHDHKVISPWCQFWPHNMSQQDLCFFQKMALLLVLFNRFNECFCVRGFKFGFQGMKKKVWKCDMHQSPIIHLGNTTLFAGFISPLQNFFKVSTLLQCWNKTSTIK